MVVVSLDMFLNGTQDTFVKYKNEKVHLVKGSINSGKTTSVIFKALYLKRNYCFDKDDKILFLTSESEIKNVAEIFNYINRSDLYMSIIPSYEIEVHVLTYSQFESYKMGYSYAHILIDNIESLSFEKIKYASSFLKNVSYSKIYFVQNSVEDLENVSMALGYVRSLVKEREGVFNFRHVIDDNERDEFTQISMTPDIKYGGYNYKEYIDFNTKRLESYYLKNGNLYLDRGTFLYDVTNESFNVNLIDESLKVGDSISILKNWVGSNEIDSLSFVKISDEGMGQYDLFREDIVLINTVGEIEDGDTVAILKSDRIYARKFSQCGGKMKFISDEILFKDIDFDDSVRVLGKVVGYIR